MAETKRITDLPEEQVVDGSDIMLLGRDGTAAFGRTTLARLRTFIFGGKSDLDFHHPIGSIYMSATDATSPAELFGGTWAQLKDCYLYCVGSGAGAYGGSASLTLSVANLPAHTHTGPSHTHSGPNHTHTAPAHTHTGPSHTHVAPEHTHTGPSHTHTTGTHVHTITVAEKAAFSTTSAGAHRHKGKYNKDGSAGTAKTRYYPDGATESADYFTVSAGDHTHSIPAHSHAASCSAASAGTTGVSGTGVTGKGGKLETAASGTGLTGSSGGTATSYAGTEQTGPSGTGATGSTGSGSAITNKPRYYGFYAWVRTA